MLEAAQVYFKRQQYLRFKSQIDLTVDSRKQSVLNEVKILNHLAARLQKKAFYCLKIYNRHSRFVRRLSTHQGQMQ
jgi:hypothetical protein